MGAADGHFFEEQEPLDGAAAMSDAHAAVVAQQVSDLRVDATFERGGGARVPVLEKCEHMAGLGGAVQDDPCFAEQVVGEAEVAVVVEGAFFREVPELLPPGLQDQPPGDRGIDVADVAQLHRDLTQRTSGPEPRVPGQLACHVHLQVEDAPLHDGVRPRSGEGGADAGATPGLPLRVLPGQPGQEPAQLLTPGDIRSASD